MNLPFAPLHISKVKIDAVKKIPWILASRAFLMLLIFILLALMLGAWVFYHYAILAETKTEQVTEKTILFKYSGYQTIVNEWQKKNLHLQESKNTVYTNPFIITPENNI